MIKYSFNICY